MATINLKNYTSTVNAAASISKIENKLVQFGATDISKTYEKQICTAIRFRIVHNGMPIFFELPAKVEKCFKVFWEDRTQKTDRQRAGVWEQAEKTAWKIISDWIEIQLSMFLLEQAELIEILLPYVYDPQTNKTFYQGLKQNNFKALLTAPQ